MSKSVNACSGSVTESILRCAMTACLEEYRMLPAKVVTHPAQYFMWDFDHSVHMGADGPTGIPVVQDIRVGLDRIELRDADDKLLVEIIHLAIPVFFEGIR